MRGTFLQGLDDPHVALREALLEGGRVHPDPLPPLPGLAAAPEATARAVLKAHVEPHGVGIVDLDRAMDSAEFRVFGAVLGTAQPERSPDVADLVEDGVILDLVTRGSVTADPAHQPFAANALTLHTESSGAPAHEQPRYIVLMCVAPGHDAAAAQTVFVPMDEVYDALPARSRALLSRLSYDRPGPVPTVLRHAGGRPVFSFRDFLDTPLNWTLDAPTDDPAAVRGAVVDLHRAMYGSAACGVRWTPGRLVVIDNTRHFHGRTAGPVPVPGRERHLRRLRVAAGGGGR